MKVRLFLTFIAATGLGLSACGKINEDKRPKYDGVPFRVSAKPINKKETLANFRVEVVDATRSQAGALEAARHEATRYCIESYGSSKFDWTNIAVDGDGSYTLQLDKGDGVYQGRCNP